MEQEVQTKRGVLEGIINDLEPTLLDSQRNINIANFITHEACQKYYRIYNKQWVPTSFIEFNFEEYKRYRFMSTNYLRPFFDIYKPEDLGAIVENYYNSNYSIIKKKSNRNDELCYYIDVRFYIDAKLSDPDMLGKFDEPLYKNLDNISKHMDKSDEILSLKEIYENYMMRKIVLGHKVKNSNKRLIDETISSLEAREKQLAEAQKEQKEEIKPDKMLVGEKSAIPNQKGRVVKMFFPKLSLPSPYPILTDKSRINSEIRSRRFASPDKQITLINKYKMNGVKYSTGFIAKRKAAQKPPKKKFDFDF
ncbi:MAG: hypothetical protein IKC11_04755 [Clostridia bacterium]|nr:hypothetical protein [Clostridia bacterium]